MCRNASVASGTWTLRWQILREIRLVRVLQREKKKRVRVGVSYRTDPLPTDEALRLGARRGRVETIVPYRGSLLCFRGLRSDLDVFLGLGLGPGRCTELGDVSTPKAKGCPYVSCNVQDEADDPEIGVQLGQEGQFLRSIAAGCCLAGRLEESCPWQNPSLSEPEDNVDDTADHVQDNHDDSQNPVPNEAAAEVVWLIAARSKLIEVWAVRPRARTGRSAALAIRCWEESVLVHHAS